MSAVSAVAVAPVIRAKIAKPAHETPSKTEIDVATCLHELENSSICEIQRDVVPITIMSAMELSVGGDETKKVIAVAFPYRVFADHVRKIQPRLIGEMEKKLRKHVVLYAKRRIMTNKNLTATGMKVLPRSRTLTAVQNSLLDDIVGPTEIVGKRIRVKIDGSKVHTVYLDPKDRNKENLEEKLDAFSEVFKKLTTKVALFTFSN